MTKTISVDAITAERIAQAAGFCRTLAAVERAYLLEDEADLHNVLDAVDPAELAHTIEVLMALHMTWQVLPDVGSEPQATATRAGALRIVSADSPTDHQPSEPTVFPGWSVRCS